MKSPNKKGFKSHKCTTEKQNLLAHVEIGRYFSIKSPLFGRAILAALNQCSAGAPFTTALWALIFTFSCIPAAAQTPHAILFII